MTSDDSLISRYAPISLLNELDNILWKNSNDITVKELWKCFTSYCYLPRLIDYGVLQGAICSGISSKGFFAIADGKDSSGKYINLRWEVNLFTVDQSAMLVKKAIAEPLLTITTTTTAETETSETGGTEPAPSKPAGGPFGGPFGGGSAKPTGGSTGEVKADSFYLSHKLDSVRFMNQLQEIYKEVIGKLLDVNGAKCQISIEVSADFTTGTIPQSSKRAIEENCNALKIDDYGFEPPVK